jgi:tryptophan synthase beta chain
MTVVQQPNSFRTGPDERGHFGLFGGRFVAETLMPLILELKLCGSWPIRRSREMDGHRENYVGRPSPLYLAERLTHISAAQIYFSARTSTHRRAQGEQRAGRSCWPAGQTASSPRPARGARRRDCDDVREVQPECVVFMGARDVARQQPDVLRMQALSAEVRPVESGAKTLKDAMNGRARLGHQRLEHLLLHQHGCGPASYPMMVRFPMHHRRRNGRRLHEAEGRLPVRSLLASAAARTPWPVPSVPDERGIEIYGPRRPVTGSKNTRPRSPAGGPACYTATAPISYERRQPDREAHSISAGSIIPASGPERLARRSRPREVSQRPTARSPFSFATGQKASSRRWPYQAGEARRHRAEETEGSLAGGQFVRPRRQGPRPRGEAFGR